MRGKGNFGTGAGKKNRGNGNVGGCGRAGSLNQRFITTIHTRTMGKRAFRAPNPTVYRTINVGELSELLSKMGKKEIDIAELGYEKLLGGGRVNGAYRIKAAIFSESAKEKISKAGGEVVSG